MTFQKSATTTEATRWLQTLVSDHNERLRNERSETNDRAAEAPFLYGQEFDIEPEIWDLEHDPEDPRSLL